jgi:hypothetical protein
MHATKVQHAQFPEHLVPGKSTRAAPLHFVSSNEEVSDAIVDMMVDSPIRLQPRAIAEIRGPPDQKPIQSVAPIFVLTR